MEKQSSQVTLLVKTKKLLQTLKQVNRAVGRRSARTVAINSEIMVTDGKFTFAVPGAIFSLECIIDSTCKASVPFLHLLEVVKDFKTFNTRIIITEGCINPNTVSLLGKTTFFEDGSILSTVDLPTNYTEAELIRLSVSSYTFEKFEFNNLKTKINKALEKLDANLDKAYLLLKQYSVTYQDLEQITKKRLYAIILKQVNDMTLSLNNGREICLNE